MKYLFDASELTPDTAKSIGIYRYATGLATAMAGQLAGHEHMVLVCNGDNRGDFSHLRDHAQVTLVCVAPAMPGHLWRQWWMRLGCALFARKAGIDLYLSPKGFVPRSFCWPLKTRRVCVMHDLIPFWYFDGMPEYFGRLETWLVSSAFRHAWKHADHIIAISSQTSAALLDRGVGGDKVSVVLNGIDGAPSLDVGRLPVGLTGRFIFGMASSLPHKNLRGLLAAYAAYRQQVGSDALPLALCGPSDVRQEGVLALGRVSDETLTALYRHADLFVFLSLIEGFGYPPIEALRAGTPVVCSDLEVFREVCGSLASYARPDDALAVATGMRQALQTPWSGADRLTLKQATHRRIASGLEWHQCAAGVLDVVRHACKALVPGQENA